MCSSVARPLVPYSVFATRGDIVRMGTLKKQLRRRVARVLLHSRQREIALAIVLTLAAAGFMTVAMLRSGASGDTQTQTSARKLTNR